MSNKSGVSEQVLPLPKGGGALSGIGETFTPDLHTGTGNFTVPIAIPSGRGGFQPDVKLIYSTGAPNGPFGMGWSLSIPGISRKTQKGLPRYDDAADTFVLSGSEDLVAVPGGSGGVTRYRPRTEGAFARIEHCRDGSGDYWQVRSKDGLLSRYGTPQPTGLDPAAIVDPDHTQLIFAWKLSSTWDTFGNQISYIYERDGVTRDGPHRWDQAYLSEIRYVDYGDPANPQFLVTLRFVYDARPDPFSDYRAGFEVRTVRRCTRIEVWTHAGADTLTRTYQIDYLDQRTPPPAQLPRNGVSLLSRITVEGHDSASSEALPPLEFAYTGFDPEARSYERLSTVGDNSPPHSLGHKEYELVDVMGNGLPSLLQMNGAVRYWRNLGSGTFDAPRAMAAAPAGVHLESPGVQIADMNGDGRADLLVCDGARAGYYSLGADGAWDPRAFQAYSRAPSFGLQDPQVRLVDLDGDGVVDALRTGARFEIFYNDPHTGWERVDVRGRADATVFPDVSFSDSRVRLGCMTGDGLQDMVYVSNGRIDYWPYLGYGKWGARVTMRNSPRFEDGATYGAAGYDPRRILLGDVDGDGCADLVYVGADHVTVWINRSGNGWSAPIVIRGTPPIVDTDAVRLADMHGTGTAGILWTYDLGAHRDSTYRFLDLTGGVKPYLLNQMDNHRGAITRVQYASSTTFYIRDQQHAATRWQTTLPFPVQVVARVDVLDALSGGSFTTEYSYHHGAWDGGEREFRGFGRVDHRDSETLAGYSQALAPPTETRTWFYQGPVGDEFGAWIESDHSSEYWTGDVPVFARPASLTAWLNSLPRRARRDALRALRGKVLRTEVYVLDGDARRNRPHSVSESLHTVSGMPLGGAWPATPEAWQLRVFVPQTVAERTTRWDRGADPLSQYTFTDNWDAYGQPLSTISVACPRGFTPASAPGSSYLATRTVTDYVLVDQPLQFVVDRVARTSTFELVNDGHLTILAFHDAVLAGSVPATLIGQELKFYDGAAFGGLSFGQMGPHGALVRTESLVLKPDMVTAAYSSAPPYLSHQTPTPWTSEYPNEFQSLLAPGAGYTYRDGDSVFARGYFANTERRQYDFQLDPNGVGCGLVTARRDALGYDTSTVYDAYALSPIQVVDAAGVATSATYDYRVLQPAQVTDPNGNLTLFTYTPLGMLKSRAVRGKTTAEGDQARAGTLLTYDMRAYAERQQPISVTTTRYVHHDTEIGVALSEIDQTVIAREYSDGFGRLLQTRTSAASAVVGEALFGDVGLPADQSLSGGDVVGTSPPMGTVRVVVGGWQTYDNKGRVVEKYEPFFATGFDYLARSDAPPALFGQKSTLFYDGPGRLVRTVNPDGSEQRVVYGAPGSLGTPDLTNPDVFEPTPWTTYAYDPNDNAGRTSPAAAQSYSTHWNTPSSTVLDALGRVIIAVERKGPDPVADVFTTRTTYDIRGNTTAVLDPMGRTAFRHVYDLANRELCRVQLDAGTRRVVYDAAGNTIEQRDAKGALVLHATDVLGRPIRMWARDNATEAITLRERLVYGEERVHAQATSANQLGRMYRAYDEAGLKEFALYDFKGNVLESAHRAIADAQILQAFNNAAASNWQIQAFRVQWDPGATPLDDYAATLLAPTSYQVSTRFDALNRASSIVYPLDAAAARFELHPTYNQAGALERVLDATGRVYIDRVAYNARGQRTFIAYGNGIMTRYAYEPQTSRLVRLRSEPCTLPAALTYHPSGPPLQDFGYTYDATGNLLVLHDRAPASGISTDPDRLDRGFAYDALYRLLSATGRESDVPAPAPPWSDMPRSADVTRARGYTETYAYDTVGNLVWLGHQFGDGTQFTRDLALRAGSNQLATVTASGVGYAYAHDACGNLTDEANERHFEWDHADRLRVFRTQTPNAEPSVHVHYLYDRAGQRVKKLVRKQGGSFETTTYVAGLFEAHALVQSGTTLANTIVHVMDAAQRVALMRVGDPLPGDSSPAVQYDLADHLFSVNLVLDGAGGAVRREEYTPYGETSFGSFARKRYRFTGKERDEESGLYYHGARYLAPWVARWISVDPVSSPQRPNGYTYCNACPTTRVDPQGTFDVNWTAVGKGALIAGVALVATVAIVATVGAAAGPIAGGVALYVGASVETAAAAATVAGGLVEAGTLTMTVMGATDVAQQTTEVMTGKEMWTGRPLSDDERSEKMGSAAVGWLATTLLNPSEPREPTPPPPPKSGGPPGPPRIPHSSGRDLTVTDFRAGGKANEAMLNEGLNRLGVRTVEQKAVRDSSGKVMQPRRHPDIVPIDAAGQGQPIDLTTPNQLNSPAKLVQKGRDALHARTSPTRGIQDDAGRSIWFGSEVTHTGGYTQMPDASGLKN